jgi:hypothetical protein
MGFELVANLNGIKEMYPQNVHMLTDHLHETRSKQFVSTEQCCFDSKTKEKKTQMSSDNKK